MKKINILVTGCGGDIGQSVGKILKEYEFISKLIGTDVSNTHAGTFIFDKCFILPRCSENNYFSSLKSLVKLNEIDLVIPLSEAEIRFFHKEKLRSLDSVKVILANEDALEVGLDKLKTSIFLQINSLIFPKTYSNEAILELEYPFISKSRFGSGSKYVFLIDDKLDLDYIRKKYPDHIFQEFLDNRDEEYTCGLFRSKDGLVLRSLVFRRVLIGGFSGFGEVIENSEIDQLLQSIAIKLNLEGSINVQLRIIESGPCVFEINPRFSSTVRFRDLLGFQDVIWSIEDKLGMRISEYTKVKPGSKFFKGFNEYIDKV